MWISIEQTRQTDDRRSDLISIDDLSANISRQKFILVGDIIDIAKWNLAKDITNYINYSTFLGQRA